MRESVCPGKERLPGVPPGPRIRFSAAWCSMSRATPASTAVPPCTSATIVSTASTPCRATWSCPVAWLTAPTAFARFAAKPSAAELLLGRKDRSRKRFDANSPRPVRSVHGQNHAKARLPSHHLRVGLRRLVEWDGLDHGGHAAQRTETERSVSGRRVPRQGTFELAAPEYEIQT